MAYKVFTNGSPLPASDLNTYLMNQSVMVFADSTARSAALTSPTEGMLTYLESDNSLYLYTGSSWVIQNPITTQGDLIVGGASGVPDRLGIGANGTYLTSNGTTASWGTVSSGGETLLATTTLSGSSISFTSIPSTYNDLKLVIRQFNPSTGTPIRMQFNGDTGGSNTYLQQSSFGVTTSQAYGSSSITLSGNNSATDATGLFVVNILDYANSVTRKIGWSNSITDSDSTSGQIRHSLYGWSWNNTNAITSVQVLVSTGTFDSGTALLYGVK